MERLRPQAGPFLGRELLELEVEHVGEGRDRVRANLADAHLTPGLARDRRERRILEAAGGDPLGEGGRVEVDVEGVAMCRHPTGDVHADRRDLPRRVREPYAGQPLDALALD